MKYISGDQNQIKPTAVYYAKSVLPNGNQPTVAQHCQAVAELAGSFAARFDKADQGYAAGLLHDFGKYGTKFQLVLLHLAEGVDHAVGGAFYALKRTRPDNRRRRKNLLEAINGHHDGLVCYDQVEQWFNEFEDREENVRTNDGKQCVFDQDSYLTAYTAFRQDFPDFKLSKPGRLEDNTLRSMLDTRMLFSCLVDADYSVSAYERDENYFINNKPADFTPELWLEKLTAYRDALRLGSDANSKVNQIRDFLYEQCGTAGDSEHTGLFTLTAPTGTGKTLALLHFALRHSIRHRKQRIILVLPFLTLLEQNADVYRQIIPELLEDHSQKELPFEAMEFAATWNAPVILTTSVKFFESLFAQKPTDCRKLHNIANSIIVFDEVQSLPPQLMSSTLQAVNALCEKYNCSMVFSTATQPEFRAIQDLSWSPMEIVPDHDGMYQALKRVNVQWDIQKETDLEVLAEEMAQKDSVCTVVNLRKHARKLYRALSEKSSQDTIFLLCTDLCPLHRSEIVSRIKERTKQGLPCRVVATQCIEAGVDLDFQFLYRALAPLESIIQAAGRCNRNGKWLDGGQVTVFVPEEKGHRYPDNWYEYAANTVRRLNHERQMDINCTEDIKRYYTSLFREQKDKNALMEAITDRDYLAVSREYRLIEQQGCQVIIPYAKEEKLFQTIREEVLTNGISGLVMRKTAGITVSVYEKQEILEQYAEQLCYPKRKGQTVVFSRYYLLRPQHYGLYSEDAGFQIPETASQDFFY